MKMRALRPRPGDPSDAQNTLNKVKFNLNFNLRQDLVIRVARDTLGQIVNPFRKPDWLPEIKSKATLRADVIAGLTVALILIPQSMAYAQLAGLPAHYGLYASLLPPIIAAFFATHNSDSATCPCRDKHKLAPEVARIPCVPGSFAQSGALAS